MTSFYAVARVEAAPASGAGMVVREIFGPPYADYVAAWRHAGTFHRANPKQIFVVVEVQS